MSDALQRGSVVLRGEQYGVVWLVAGTILVLHPVRALHRRMKTMAYDVELSLAELVGAGIAMPGGVVRCGQPVRIDRAEQVVVGQLAGQASCRITLATTRAFADAEITERWEAERRHRNQALSLPPVRMGD